MQKKKWSCFRSCNTSCNCSPYSPTTPTPTPLCTLSTPLCPAAPISHFCRSRLTNSQTNNFTTCLHSVTTVYACANKMYLYVGMHTVQYIKVRPTDTISLHALHTVHTYSIYACENDTPLHSLHLKCLYFFTLCVLFIVLYHKPLYIILVIHISE